jgi:phage shock protein E
MTQMNADKAREPQMTQSTQMSPNISPCAASLPKPRGTSGAALATALILAPFSPTRTFKSMKTTLSILSILAILGLGLPMLNAAPPVEKPATRAAAKALPGTKALPDANALPGAGKANPQMDYAAHLALMQKAMAIRKDRRLTEERFLEMAAEPGVIVLDARSADKYRRRHIKGAISLPFTDFNEGSLAKVIPAKDTKVLIYCNNNFRGDELAFASKAVRASLNIDTFTSLVGYGYTNVWELGPNLDVKATKVPFEGEFNRAAPPGAVPPTEAKPLR